MTAIRLHITAEGLTEKRFGNNVLVPHLGNRFQVVTDVRSVKTGRKHGQDCRGGLLGYEKAKNDIQSWMRKERNNIEVRFTTMFDLYALPNDFPGYPEAAHCGDPYQRVAVLESALARDMGDERFIPYIQLHEFEALILADPQTLDSVYMDETSAIVRLVELTRGANPEEINDGPDTAPSKRIIAEIPAYEKQKAAVGPFVAEKIGLDVLRQRCRHFHEWMETMERLGHEAD